MIVFKDKHGLTDRSIELTAILAVVILALGTRWGAGVGGDATIYITSARSLIHGLGLGLPGPQQGEFRLLPYFPPFFSLVLSVFGLLQINLAEAARWLNIGCFAGLVYLAGHFTFRFSQKSVLSILAAVILAVSPVLIPVYAWAMSEPLSALLGFGGLILTIYAIKYPQKAVYLIFAAVLSGLSFLTRYSAAAFIGAALAGIFFLTQAPRGKRIIKALEFGIISAIPMGIWVVYDILNTATVGSRRLLTLADMISRFASFWPPLKAAILFWIIPESWYYAPVYPAYINQALLLAVLVILLAWAALAARRFYQSSRDFDNRFIYLITLLAGFILVYFMGILGVYLTTYPPITIANRMLSPLYSAALWLVVLLAIMTGKLWPKNKIIETGLTTFLIVICVYYGWRSARLVRDYYNDGQGYTAPAWQQSQTMEQVRKLPAGTLIVSNEINAIQFLADRPAYQLMEPFSDHPLDVFSRYGDGTLNNDKPQQLFHDGKAVLVLFDTIDDQMSGLYGDRTNERISDLVKGLKQVYRGSDGGVFIYGQP